MKISKKKKDKVKKINIKERTFEIVEAHKEGDITSKIFDIFIITLILLNVLAVTLESLHDFTSKYSTFFRTFEAISVIIFTVEYFLRVWSCTIDKKYENPIIGRIKFIFTPLPLIDLFAILPFYLFMFVTIDLRFLRALRLIRSIRLLKLERYSRALYLLEKVIKNKRAELITGTFIIFVLYFIGSSFMYVVENEAQPSAFSSIPDSMWWGVNVLTNSNADVNPITPLGKIIGCFVAFLGVALFVLPTAILGAGYIEEFQIEKGKKTKCPHCGKSIEKLK